MSQPVLLGSLMLQEFASLVTHLAKPVTLYQTLDVSAAQLGSTCIKANVFPLVLQVASLILMPKNVPNVTPIVSLAPPKTSVLVARPTRF